VHLAGPHARGRGTSARCPDLELASSARPTRRVEIAAGLHARPGSTTTVPHPSIDELGPLHEALADALESYTSKSNGLFSRRRQKLETAAAAWAQAVEDWVRQDPTPRSGWIEGWLWGCDIKLIDLAEKLGTDAPHRREEEAYRIWWNHCLAIWSTYASEEDQRLRRETKWWHSPCSRGGYDLYLTGFRPGVFPEGLPYTHLLLCQILGWSEPEATAIATRAAHIGPQLIASQISEQDVLDIKTSLESWVKFKVKAASSTAAGSSDSSSRRREAISEKVRQEVWRLDEGRCVDCGSRDRLEFDHIIPVARSPACSQPCAGRRRDRRRRRRSAR
jgi:hypothetical protein